MYPPTPEACRTDIEPLRYAPGSLAWAIGMVDLQIMKLRVHIEFPRGPAPGRLSLPLGISPIGKHGWEVYALRRVATQTRSTRTTPFKSGQWKENDS